MDEDEAKQLVQQTAKRWMELELRIEQAKEQQWRLMVELSDAGVTNYRIAKFWDWRVSQTTVGKWIRWGRALTTR